MRAVARRLRSLHGMLGVTLPHPLTAAAGGGGRAAGAPRWPRGSWPQAAAAARPRPWPWPAPSPPPPPLPPLRALSGEAGGATASPLEAQAVAADAAPGLPPSSSGAAGTTKPKPRKGTAEAAPAGGRAAAARDGPEQLEAAAAPRGAAEPLREGGGGGGQAGQQAPPHGAAPRAAEARHARASGPRPRRSSSQSMAAKDEALPKKQPQQRAAKAAPTSAAAAAAAAAPAGARANGKPARAGARAPAGAAAGAAAAPPDPEPNLRLRNAFGGNRAAAALVPPSAPVSPEGAAWFQELGVPADTLERWGVGMALVPHPQHSGQQVEVLALPYLVDGRLVDVRYLHLSGGRLAGSWLAVGARQLFMRQQELQGASVVVFVSCELDVLVLSAAGVAAAAAPQQAPTWCAASPQPHGGQQHDQQQQNDQQQQHDYQQQQQQQQQQLPEAAATLPSAVQQLLQLRLQQRLQQQGAVHEDPRLRLAGLTAQLGELQRQHEIGMTRKAAVAAAAAADVGVGDAGWQEEGLQVSDVSRAAPSGLRLLLPSASHAVIAMEEGPVGDAVGAELASLLGEVTCRHAQWPDASPVQAAGAGAPPLAPELDGAGWSVALVAALRGADGLASAVQEAYVWPIPGLERFSDHVAELIEYYETPDMGQLAVSTGWPCLDEYYKVSPGEVTLVSGVPNSGKSEWLDALAVNLAHLHGWRFAMCSMEKRPRDHAKQLVEKIAGKPMLRAAYAEEVPRMTEEELVAAYRKLCDHFVVIASGEDSMPSVTWVLEKAKAAVIQYGIRGLVIDPYNELDPTRPASLKEHEHVNELMGRLRAFARSHGVHVWLVAHPRQMSSLWQGQRPGLQDISGGANFMNKADNGIIVHRDWSKMKELQARGGGGGGGGGGQGRGRCARASSSGGDGAEDGAEDDAGGASSPSVPASSSPSEYDVSVVVEKVRNKTTGCKGECVLVYDRATGRYHEPGAPPDRRPLGAADAAAAAGGGWPAQDAAGGAEAEAQYERQRAAGEAVEAAVEAANSGGALSPALSGPEEEQAVLEEMRERSQL